ncbi:MAG: dihydrolipoyl dehydrogenase [Thermoplasmata archaeon]|nr:dihydrolipoyl dehydrogenase [Thermoplasmata archaeon]MCI4355793.1 dihydrolipoyl dehydrogenase [Thermoplasmata archaeon]
MAGTYARQTDLLVIGGGPGGYVAAIRAGQLGVKTLLVERRELGGECLNRGCIPSKALIHASLLYQAIRTEGPEVGVKADGVTFDLAQANRWKDAVVAKERSGVALLLRSAGVEVLFGEARFTGPRSAELAAADGGRERIDFQTAIVATGAVPSVIPGFEPDGERVVTAEQLLNWTSLPKSVLVLGGGVSGCELGEFLARVGVAVTVVELMPQILPGLDPDLAQELTKTLTTLGVTLLVGTKATKLERSESGVNLTVETGGSSQTLEAERLFLTIGKRPATSDLGLEDAGVERPAKSGFLTVNDRQQTNVPTIFAVGDVARPPMLAHKAYREGVVAAEVVAGKPTRYVHQAMPSVVFTTPELASVGETSAEATAAGRSPREVRFPFGALGRAHAAHATSGWLKLVGDEPTGLLLGVQAAGENVGEFVAEAGLAIEMGATVRDVAMTIHPHPTFCETLQEAALLWLGEPLHVARRPPGGARSR